MATTDQAKQAVVHEWDDWVRTQPIEGIAIGRDAFKFFLELRAKDSALLHFESDSQDKWQVVHGWLLDQWRVAD